MNYAFFAAKACEIFSANGKFENEGNFVFRIKI